MKWKMVMLCGQNMWQNNDAKGYLCMFTGILNENKMWILYPYLEDGRDIICPNLFLFKVSG